MHTLDPGQKARRAVSQVVFAAVTESPEADLSELLDVILPRIPVRTLLTVPHIEAIILDEIEALL